jgi:L-aspartate oxidase
MLNAHTAAPFPSPPPKAQTECSPPQPAAPPADFQKAVEEVRAILWEKVAIIRDGRHLTEAVKSLSDLTLAPPSHPSRRIHEAANILTVARLIARCALARQESRGAHYRSDFPLKNELKRPQHSYLSQNSLPFFE